MQGQLRKPVFIKVKDLSNGRSAYNVYVKVVEVTERAETEAKVPIVRAVVADETGCANAFFKGEPTKLIKEGAIIAIRNGTIKFIKNRISLEIDMFGRITEEKVDIKPSTDNNISEKEVERRKRPARRDNNNDRRERNDGDRRPRRDRDEDRRPRREEEGERRPRRNEDDYEDRRPRRDGDRRPRRNEDGEFNDRRPRREDGDRRPRRTDDFDRRPRREDDGGRRPRRNEDFDRRPRNEDDRRERRPPVQFTKIADIEPADENLNFFGQVLSVQSVGRRARVTLGDETAIVRAFLYRTEHIEEGETIVLFRAEAQVIKEHIEIQLMDGGKVDTARRAIKEVNKDLNISAKEWIEADD